MTRRAGSATVPIDRPVLMGHTDDSPGAGGVTTQRALRADLWLGTSVTLEGGRAERSRALLRRLVMSGTPKTGCDQVGLVAARNKPIVRFSRRRAASRPGRSKSATLPFGDVLPPS